MIRRIEGYGNRWKLWLSHLPKVITKVTDTIEIWNYMFNSLSVVSLFNQRRQITSSMWCVCSFSAWIKTISYIALLNFISCSHSASISLVPTMWTVLWRSVYITMSHFLSPRSFVYTIHLNIRHRGEKDT